MTSCGLPQRDDDEMQQVAVNPDVAMILKGIATSSTMKILTANFNAMQMLGEEHREGRRITGGSKRELTQKEEA